MAMRRCEPIVLIASGNEEGAPLTVGLSKSSAFPPAGDFISRSAISVISSSVATPKGTRFNSPAFSSAATKAENESKAMCGESRRWAARVKSDGEEVKRQNIEHPTSHDA